MGKILTVMLASFILAAGASALADDDEVGYWSDKHDYQSAAELASTGCNACEVSYKDDCDECDECNECEAVEVSYDDCNVCEVSYDECDVCDVDPGTMPVGWGEVPW